MWAALVAASVAILHAAPCALPVRAPAHVRTRSAMVAPDDATRREILRLSALASSAAAVASAVPMADVQAIGPVNIGLDVTDYKEVTCPPELAAGRIGGSIGSGASKGVKQRCVKVTAMATNPEKKPISDAAVFGRVFSDDDNNSVVANNPDGRTDAGQFAMIPSLPPGESTVEFVFVATDSKPELPKLRFESLKAISYPGGDRYRVYDECEQNPAMEGCGMDDE